MVRGDFGHIEIGPGSNVQDNSVIHVNGRHDTILGANVTVGHSLKAAASHRGARILESE